MHAAGQGVACRRIRHISSGRRGESAHTGWSPTARDGRHRRQAGRPLVTGPPRHPACQGPQGLPTAADRWLVQGACPATSGFRFRARPSRSASPPIASLRRGALLSLSHSFSLSINQSINQSISLGLDTMSVCLSFCLSPAPPLSRRPPLSSPHSLVDQGGC